MPSPAWVAIAAVLLASPVWASPGMLPSPATPQSADRTQIITSKTRSVRVFHMETVLFKIGGKQFALTFDGGERRYDLAAIAPHGMVTRKIVVYVNPSPTDIQGAR
jgi:hypothetical protein